MEWSWKKFVYCLPVFAAELATGWNLFGYYSYHEVPFVAFLLATCYSVLLVGTTMLFSKERGRLIGTLIILGGIVTFSIQALANISEAFLHGLAFLPADRLSVLWHVTPNAWFVLSAWISGLAINIVGLIYWIALGVYFRRERQAETEATAKLQELMSKTHETKEDWEKLNGAKGEQKHVVTS